MASVYTFTPPHPEAVKAKDRVAALKAEQQFQKKFVEDRVKDQGFKFVSFPPTTFSTGMALCYTVQRRDVLHVSSAFTHPDDRYAPDIGKYIAAKAMSQGHWITLKKPGPMPASAYLYEVFKNASVKPVSLSVA